MSKGNSWMLLFSSLLLLFCPIQAAFADASLTNGARDEGPGAPGAGYSLVEHLQNEDTANSRDVIRDQYSRKGQQFGQHVQSHHHRQVKRRGIKNLNEKHVLHERGYPKRVEFVEEQAMAPSSKNLRVSKADRATKENERILNAESQRSRKSRESRPNKRRGRDSSFIHERNQINFSSNSDEHLQLMESENLPKTMMNSESPTFAGAARDREMVKEIPKENKEQSTHKNKPTERKTAGEIAVATFLGFTMGFTCGFFISTVALMLFALFGHYGCQILYDESNDTYRSTDKIDGFEEV